MIVKGKSSFTYWKDSEEGEEPSERVYSWKEIFGGNPAMAVLPFDLKSRFGRPTKLYRTASSVDRIA